MKKLVLLFIGFALMTLVHAASAPSPQEKYVNDFAHVLTTDDVDLLRYTFEEIEQNTTAQIVFVSVVNASGYSPSDYATMVGQEWGVGQADVDNGVVILYVADVNKIWVSTGYGVEGILPDSKVGRMLDTYYVPLRDAGNLSQGITDFSIALADELEANREELISKQGAGKGVDLFTIVVIIIIILIIISVIARSRGTRLWWIPVFIPGGSSSSGGFGGGFGGGGFGGGGAGR